MRIHFTPRLAIAATVGLILIPLSSGTAHASEQVIAEQTVVNNYGYVHNISGGSRWAQTFVPSISGSLNKVTLLVDGTSYSTNANLVVAIETTTAGLPSGTTLTSVSVPANSLPATVTTFDFTFTTSAAVQASVTYAIVVYSPTTVSSYGVGLNTAGGYAYGTAAYADWTSSWTAASSDLYFVAFISVDSTGTSSNPPDIQEAFGLPASGNCDIVPVEVRTNISDRVTGWGKSWTGANWLHSGAGGSICIRTLRYDATIQGYAAVS